MKVYMNNIIIYNYLLTNDQLLLSELLTIIKQQTKIIDKVEKFLFY